MYILHSSALGDILFLKAPWIWFCAENPLSQGTEVRGIVWKTCATVTNEGVCHRKHLALHSSWRGLSLLLLRVLVTCNSTSSPHQKETFFGRNNENKSSSSSKFQRARYETAFAIRYFSREFLIYCHCRREVPLSHWFAVSGGDIISHCGSSWLW